jgi:uncharacterized membrane protein
MDVLLLTLMYWLHLIASVLWIGGLAMLVLMIWPNLLPLTGEQREGFYPLIDDIEQRFRPAANVSLVILLATGIVQMSGDPYYEGFLAISNPWSVALLVKHMLFGLMLAISLILQSFLLPDLDRVRLLNRQGKRIEGASEVTLRARLRTLTTLNLGIGVIILLLTALMTAL